MSHTLHKDIISCPSGLGKQAEHDQPWSSCPQVQGHPWGSLAAITEKPELDRECARGRVVPVHALSPRPSLSHVSASSSCLCPLILHTTAGAGPVPGVGIQDESPVEAAETRLWEPPPAASQGVHSHEAGVGSRAKTHTEPH